MNVRIQSRRPVHIVERKADTGTCVRAVLDAHGSFPRDNLCVGIDDSTRCRQT